MGPDYFRHYRRRRGVLRGEVHHVERLIEKLMKAEITDNLHAAIGSFAYNCGTGALQRSTFRQYINQARHEDTFNGLLIEKLLGRLSLIQI